MNRMVDDLVALCDQLEQYGLVDYEMGIWEEEITHIFTVCIDLLPQEESTSEGRTQRTTSTWNPSKVQQKQILAKLRDELIYAWLGTNTGFILYEFLH